MNFEIRVQSTMLPTRVDHTFETDGASGDFFDAQIEAIQEMVTENAASAEFRVVVLQDDTEHDVIKWMTARLSDANVPALEIVCLLLAVRGLDYDDEKQVMTVVYGEMAGARATADSVISHVSEGAYHVDYNHDLERAFADFGRSYYMDGHTEMSLDGNEDYFDWSSFGKDMSEGNIEYADGDHYVWREWA
jgi:hypothetical protein